MKQMPRAKLWFIGVIVALVTISFVCVFFLLIGNLHLKISVSPKNHPRHKKVIFDTRNSSVGTVADSSIPNGPIPNVTGKYKLHYVRYGRYLGIFQIPDLDGILEIRQDGEKITGSVLWFHPKTGTVPKNAKPQPIVGVVTAPNRIEFKTPPAPNPPVRWLIYIGTIQEQKDGTKAFKGDVKIHQEGSTKRGDTAGEASDIDSVDGNWSAVKILDEK